jgi:hypothetical protein
MKVTVNLPDVTPQQLDVGVEYWGYESRSEFIRKAIAEALEVVFDDVILGPDGDCIGSRSSIEEELFPEGRQWTTKQDREGEAWKDGEPEEE